MDTGHKAEIHEETFEEKLQQVVATGGSAVYSDVAMKHLEDGSKVVYLKVSLDDLKSRLTDMKERGVAIRPDESIEMTNY